MNGQGMGDRSGRQRQREEGVRQGERVGDRLRLAGY